MFYLAAEEGTNWWSFSALRASRKALTKLCHGEEGINWNPMMLRGMRLFGHNLRQKLRQGLHQKQTPFDAPALFRNYDAPTWYWICWDISAGIFGKLTLLIISCQLQLHRVAWWNSIKPPYPKLLRVQGIILLPKIGHGRMQWWQPLKEAFAWQFCQRAGQHTIISCQAGGPLRGLSSVAQGFEYYPINSLP